LGSTQILFGSDYQSAEKTVHNSLLYYSGGGKLQSMYAKMHLVPGGEYFPLRLWFQKLFPQHWLQKITPGEQDFVAGLPLYTVVATGLPPFRCLICYESIFPGTIRNPDCVSKDIDPEWILTITNDGWFGKSSGPYQHFLSARFRSIEEGLPLVRVANTGISAIVDPLGRIMASLPLYHQGVMDGLLPHAIPKTWYGLWHDRILWLMVGLVSCVITILRIRRRRSV
jgi:apolipoprotein N-acyltransferase